MAGFLNGSRRLTAWRAVLGVALVAALVRGPLPTAAQSAPPSAPSDQAAAVVAIARDAMAKYDLKAVILRVTIDGQEVVTAALGESMTGVPATTDMRFRNGAVAFSYVATLLLIFVDRGLASLDDPLARWLPDVPDADRVTLRMLANMTAGYPDYVPDQSLIDALYANPFRHFTEGELVAIGLRQPRLFAPGTNWDYSHTNYVLLGQALERIGGQPLAALLRENVLQPLSLNETVSEVTAAIRPPVLHAFTAERRQTLHIPAGTPFLEESTYWNPSWTTAAGAIQTTNIYDMTATAEAVGNGTLLSAASHQAQVGPSLVGFGAPLAGCRTCSTLTVNRHYGLGVVLLGSWVLQNPLFAGCGAVEGYLPDRKLAIAVATTFNEGAFDDQGDLKVRNPAEEVFGAIAAYLAPGEEPRPRS